MAAAKAILDTIHEALPSKPDDSNAYILGSIQDHNIVIACLPSSHYGTNNAATVANNMRRSFPFIDKGLLVGIAGGVPETADVRLGDVVVAHEVMQYDFGKTLPKGLFHRTGLPTRPPQILMTAVSKLRAEHDVESSKIPAIIRDTLDRRPHMSKYAHPGLQDRLFCAQYNHVEAAKDCDLCDPGQCKSRPAREGTNPHIHYGRVASGNQVIEDGNVRTILAEELGIICFEMEAAGCRGICDYSDSHKNKAWQEYSAITAAAYAKELLCTIPPTQKGLQVGPPKNRKPLPKMRQLFLESFHFKQIESRHANIKDAYGTTCQWFLAHPLYLDWLDFEKLSSHHGLLWIKGKPGAGKSTLLKFIYTDSRTRSQSTEDAAVISFFFNARGTELEISTIGMYRSLLLQILERFPDLQEILDELIHRHREKDPIVWETWSLQLMFANAIKKLEGRHLTCFIDALDECDETQVRDMFEAFERLGEMAVKNGIHFHVCFSSRHYAHIDIQYGLKLTLEHQSDHRKDLEGYIRNKLPAPHSQAIEEVTMQVIEKSSGVFMWVVLVVDILNKEFQRGRVFAVKRRLEELSVELSALFREIFQRDAQNMDDLLLCLQWILYAEEPLTCKEFYYALVSGLDPTPENMGKWEPNLVTEADMELFVLSSSKGLAELTQSYDHRTVQFIHESIRDFLLKDNGISDLWPDYAQNFESRSHERLNKCCYNYFITNASNILSSFDASEEVSITPDYWTTDHPSANLPEDKATWPYINERPVQMHFPFINYATSYVLSHAEEAASFLLQGQFLKEFGLELWIELRGHIVVSNYTPQASLIYVLADNSCSELIKTILSPNLNIHTHGEKHEYPLFAALARGSRSTVEALFHLETGLSREVFENLDYGTQFVPQGGMTPLHWAARIGSMPLFKHLLGFNDFGMNRQDSVGYTPLSFAAENGRDTIVKLLLSTKGVNKEPKDASGRTPLLQAAEFGHEDSVRLLLECEDVDRNSRDGQGCTPLLQAILNDELRVVDLLLRTLGVDPNIRDEDSMTPLHWAAKSGQDYIVDLLLKNKSVDLDPKDAEGKTPLFWSAFSGQETIVDLLLATNMVEPDPKDNNGKTPLYWAVKHRKETIVERLLEFDGVDPNVQDERSYAPFVDSL